MSSSSLPSSKFKVGDRIFRRDIPQYLPGEIIGPHKYWDDRPGEVWYRVWFPQGRGMGLVLEEAQLELDLLFELAHALD